MSLCSFLFFGRPVVVFGDLTLHIFFERSRGWTKSKRIFLSADVTFIVLSIATIQPVPELPRGSFIVLCLAANDLQGKRFRKAIHFKKIC
ncbi:hypothetical protein BTW15_09395 [Pseudomonas syringae pv. tomato]|uniref:Secreted protein n=1 Tax=Pseudomonas syringae pv. tomato TaxID=323 RepID=A0AB36KUI6_PSEUB|nr:MULTISPECIES: hypothetical protein [Pseudomonas syringae group]MBI6850549.1 hypothetical protein [Pseudomonas syringae]MBX6507444.1 hypothetical protein [Pseudomonas syringae pv. tomato]OPE60311.1 hypothetical protein BTW15_09395 [Pseudomonas syringae pv. tomato]RMU94408.1 hypothetical protein ALP19_100591 [Pseudomonas syringae pv. tomato]TES55387.1 hypothetical protein E2N91_22315 [Pseudomonas syringae pv. tomato]